MEVIWRIVLLFLWRQKLYRCQKQEEDNSIRSLEFLMTSIFWFLPTLKLRQFSGVGESRDLWRVLLFRSMATLHSLENQNYFLWSVNGFPRINSEAFQNTIPFSTIIALLYKYQISLYLNYTYQLSIIIEEWNFIFHTLFYFLFNLLSEWHWWWPRGRKRFGVL